MMLDILVSYFKSMQEPANRMLTFDKCFRITCFLLVVFLLAAWPKQPALASGTVTNCTSWIGGLPGISDTLGELLPNGGTITFACNGTINAQGFDIMTSTTLDASNQNVTLVGFFSEVSAVFNLKNLTLSEGSVTYTENGGGTLTNVNFTNSEQPLINNGNLTLQGGQFTDNATALSGGAITNAGTLTATNTQFTNNSAIDLSETCTDCGYGGAIDNVGGMLTLNHATFQFNSSSFQGAALMNRNDGDAIINDSTFDANGSEDWQAAAIFGDSANPGHFIIMNDSSVINSIRGGGIIVAGSPLTINNSLIDGNTSVVEGGGIIFAAEGEEDTLTISGSTITHNVAGFPGGGIKIVYLYPGANMITHSDISSNTGGGISIETNGGYPLTISQSSITNNTSSKPGGGIQSGIDLNIVESSITDNTASSGGGIYMNGANATLTLDRSLVASNVASGGALPGDGFGGGINSINGNVTVVNSTFTDNAALNKGGAIYIQNASSAHTYSVLSSTFSGNDASFGRSLYNETANPKKVSVKNSILSGDPGISTQCFGPIIHAGNNLSSDNSCIGFKVVDAADIALQPLASNGGLTETMALIASSPAVDGVPVAQCGVSTDQRGGVRPLGNGCDIGAFESPFTFSLPNAAPSRNFFVGTPITLTWNGVNWSTGYEVVVDSSSTFTNPLNYQKSDISADALQATVSSLPVGTYYWRVRAKKPDGSWGAWSAVESFIIA